MAPRSLKDLQSLLAARVQESIHLDYKDSRALLKWPGELSKDVSAFANSDGGTLIYGIREDNHFPIAIDDGSDNATISRERIEQHLRSNIAPRLEGLLIHPIPLTDARSAYVIEVPKSHRAPHQDRATMKYYKRWNFESIAMEHYELSDLRARSREVAPLVTFEVELRRTTLFLFVVANRAHVPAYDVSFTFSAPLSWEREPPAIITNGIAVLPPGREYRVFYGVGHEILGEKSTRVADFDVDISYFHPGVNQRTSETVKVNLRDYLGTWSAESPTKELSESIQNNLTEVRDQLRRVADALEGLTSISRPSGLEFSNHTLQSIALSLGHVSHLPKYDLRHRSPEFYGEVLGVGNELSYMIWEHLRRTPASDINTIPGITPEVVGRMRELLQLDGKA
jgi:hypothetical protein